MQLKLALILFVQSSFDPVNSSGNFLSNCITLYDTWQCWMMMMMIMRIYPSSSSWSLDNIFLNQRDSCCHHQFSSSLNKDRNYSYFFQKKSLTPSEHVENKCAHSPIFSISIDTTHLHAWILCWKDYSIDCSAVTLMPWSGTIYDTDLVLVEINDLDARRESHSVTQLD